MSAEKLQGKRLAGRQTRTWEDDIKIYFGEIKRELDSSGSGYDAIAGFCGHRNKTSFTI
jgi:hypothetical protein